MTPRVAEGGLARVGEPSGLRALLAEITVLAGLTTTALARRHQEVFGRPTKSRDGDWLRRRISRHLEARARARPLTRAERVALRRALRRALVPAAPRVFRSDPRHPPVGTVLRRTFRGRTVEVEVTPAGFLHEGRLYRSLSGVARAVSGTPWNGFLFFNLINARGGGPRAKGAS